MKIIPIAIGTNNFRNDPDKVGRSLNHSSIHPDKVGTSYFVPKIFLTF
ncbi:MAG: hypothetical protein WC557_08865 [Ignavibacteriaceae bacterium]